MTSMKIATIRWPAPAVFKSEFVKTGTPVIIAHGLGDCVASTWTPEKLCSIIGHKKIRVAISLDNGTFGYTQAGAAYQLREIEFSTAVSLMNISTTTKYYIMQMPIREVLPELEPQIAIPPVIERSDLKALNFWLSSSGSITSLHYDTANNFLAQIYGRKEIVLFSPDQTAFMYPLGYTANHPHVSQVNYLNPDLNQFPKFAKAVSIQITLEAGDVLYIPAYWWHGVKTNDLSISLNYWWKICPYQYFVPAAIDTLVATYDRKGFKSDMDVHEMIESAKYALRKNLVWAASLFAAAALEEHLRSILQVNHVLHETMPSRLDFLNSEVLKLGNGYAIDPTKIDIWIQLVKLSRQTDNKILVTNEVTAMVEDIANTVSAPQ